MRKIPTWLVAAVALIILLNLALMSGWFGAPPEPRAEVSYTEFKTLLAEGQVESVVLRGDRLEGRLLRERRPGQGGAPNRHVTTRIPAFGDPALLPGLEAQGVEISVADDCGDGALSNVLAGLLPWILTPSTCSSGTGCMAASPVGWAVAATSTPS